MRRACLFLALCFVSAAAANAQTTVLSRVACAGCAIEHRTTVTLGSVSGAGALSGAARSATLDSQGRFWLLVGNRAPLLFAPNGSFLREVGRIGQGPGEFESPSRLLAVGDSVVVFDGLGRATVIRPDLTVARTFTAVQARRPPSIALMRWPNEVVFGGAIRLTAGAGYPLHLADLSGPTSRIVRSYGSDGVVLPDDPALMRIGGVSQEMLQERGIVATENSLFAVTKFSRYVLSNWDGGGKLLWELHRQADFFPEKDTWTIGNPDRKPDPRVIAIWYDSRRYLWVFGHVAAADWQQKHRDFRALNPVVAPPPGTSATRSSAAGQSIQPHTLYHTMVEVIDVQAKSLVASRLVPAFITDVLPDGRFVSYRENSDGIPFIDIVALSLRGGM